MPVGPTDRPSVQLWLPECFNSMLVDLIAQEDDEIHRGALGRCLHGLRLQTITSPALASQEVLREASLPSMRFSQYLIQFGNGVDPPRLFCLCNMLYAASRLLDEEVWTENAAIFLSLPEYCSACDIFGHATADCILYRGLSRTERSFVPQDHISGKYKLEKLGLTLDFLRVIGVNGKRWELQSATGINFNCLIDTVRQSLGLPSSLPLLDSVRNDLAKEFPVSRGEFQVRTSNHLLGPSFLEFLEHTRAVARLLLQKAGAEDQRHEDLKFVCVDLDREKFSVLDGVGSRQREIVFVRENGNHFLPVLPSETPLEMLLPWNTDVASIRAKRRRAKEAAWLKEVAERRKRDEAAAQLERARRQKALEDAAAAKKREEEAAAAAKKREEEAAAELARARREKAKKPDAYC